MHNAQDFCSDWSRIDAIDGWLRLESAALMDFCLAGQDKARLPGSGLLEIGVWKGRSAALMARHLRTGESMWLLDSWPQQEDVRKSLKSLLGERIQNHGITLFSGTAREATLAIPQDRRYRYIHVDGEHTAAGLRADLVLARRLMEHTGLIVIDDIFNGLYPQLARAMFAFLDNEGRDLVCVLLGFNKACLCHTQMLDTYGDLIFDSINAEMAARGVPVTLCRTTDRVEWPGYALVHDMGMPKRGPDNNDTILRR